MKFSDYYKGLNENSTEDCAKSLDAIIGTLEKRENPSKTDKSMLKMATGIKDYYKKEGSFSPDQASFVYQTSKALFK